MKRAIGILISVFLLVGMLSGCGAKGELQGLWQADADLSAVMQSILKESWPSSLHQVKDFQVTLELSFQKNGTCTFGVQEGSLQQALEKLGAALEEEFVKSIQSQMTVLDKNVSLEDLLKLTGVDLETLLGDIKKTFQDADFTALLREKMRFDGYYEIRNERLYIATTEEIDDQDFAFIYKIQDGVLTMPMVAGVSPMELALTAAICPLSFHKVK